MESASERAATTAGGAGRRGFRIWAEVKTPRMRHAGFSIGAEEHDRWLLHMLAALDGEQLPAALDGPLRAYLVRAAAAMVNAG